MRKKYPEIDIYVTGQNIRKIMLRRGYTVKDIQKHLGLAAPQSVYHWFDGRSLPTLDNLYALSELFHVPMDMLVCGSGRDHPLWYQPTYLRVLLYSEKWDDLFSPCLDA